MSFIRIRRRKYNVTEEQVIDKKRQKFGVKRSEKASKRRTERAEIVKHRKWIFMSIAVIALVALVFFIIIKVT